MEDILDRIYAFDISTVIEPKIVGKCAICDCSVNDVEDELVNEFWREFCRDFCRSHMRGVYIDLVVECDKLRPEQFNKFHEPLLCLNCLKGAIHKE